MTTYSNFNAMAMPGNRAGSLFSAKWMKSGSSNMSVTSIAIGKIPRDDDGTILDDIMSVAVLPISGQVFFPHCAVPITLSNDSAVRLAEDAMKSKAHVLLVTQIDQEKKNPGSRDLYHIGVLGKVEKIIELPDGNQTALMTLSVRARLGSILKRKPYLTALCYPCAEEEPKADDVEMAVLFATLTRTYMSLLDEIGADKTQELRFALRQCDDELRALNFMAANFPGGIEEKVDLLMCDSLKERVELLIKKLMTARNFIELQNEIQERTKEDISQQQKEHFLQQQIRKLQEELGQNPEDEDVVNLRKRASEKIWSEEIKARFEKELHKLERYAVQNPEYSVQYSYLETLLDLPWDELAESKFDTTEVERILDRDHYGLEKVKDRILEQIAVLQLRKDMKAPILCLYGPPGVGKTSLGRSVAEALNRPYARVSLGGLHDEAEIRGHRRTYIGAMPGRILAAMIKAGKSNPVFVLDEIDKIGKDFKGDPSTALLEVLDPEQNSKFHDNYVDVDYDLSKVLFIATANSLSGISKPLLDRMELVEVPGYITEEKIEIGLRHLFPKNLKEHGMEASDLEITHDGLEVIIDRYTRESGVRQLDKKIATLMRRVARLKATGQEWPKTLGAKEVRDLLGVEEVYPTLSEGNDVAGVVTGLAWTQAGGEILFIETSLAPAKDERLTLTGNLGDVMKESATIALQWLKAHASAVNLTEESFAKKAVHIHVPEGAIPKDGPSAGIAMLTSLASAFTGRLVKEKLAMTGEITLRGKVLPVGGIKEKILAAKRAGIKEIILCGQNRKDIEEIEPRYLEGLKFNYVGRMEEVLDLALIPG